MQVSPTGIKISFGGRRGRGDEDRPVVARIVGLADDESGETILREMVVPPGGVAEEELPKGLYNVQLTLPSGRILQRNVKIAATSNETYEFFEDFAPGAGFSLQESSGLSDDQLIRESALASGNSSQRPDIRDLTPFHEFAGRLGGVSGGGLGGGGSGEGGGDEGLPLEGGSGGGFGGDLGGPALEEAGIAGEHILELEGEPHAAANIGIARGAVLSDRGTLLKKPRWTAVEPREVRGSLGIWEVESKIEGKLHAGNRLWARTELPDGGVEIASLPLPWFCTAAKDFTAAEILVDPSRQGGAATTVAIRDARLSGLLAYLDRGQASAAKPLLEELERENLIELTIEDKMSNPLAACAAAYVGLSVYPPGEREQWDGWLQNCMKKFPGIPDAAIVHARRLILRPDTSSGNEQAADALRRAMEAGTPFFSAGVTLLREMLLLLSADYRDLTKLADRAADLAVRVDPTQIFTVLRFPPGAKD